MCSTTRVFHPSVPIDDPPDRTRREYYSTTASHAWCFVEYPYCGIRAMRCPRCVVRANAHTLQRHGTRLSNAFVSTNAFSLRTNKRNTLMLTRTQARRRSHTPPPLRRTSAIATVRFTPMGRRMARRMMMPTRDPKIYYWFTSLHGETTHHFHTSGGTFSVTGSVVPEVEMVPHRSSLES